MSRIRTIKPDFFLNEDIAELTLLARLTFIGLWTIADKEGRLEDRPKRIKAQLFPYDDCDMNALLQELHCATGRFILRYVAQDCAYIQVRNFTKHQRITGTEAQSSSRIPPPENEKIFEVQQPDNAQTGNNVETTWNQQENVEEADGNTMDDWKGYIGKEGNGEKDKCANAQMRSIPSTVSFDSDFWAIYPNKKDKERARKSWLKLKPDEELVGVITQAIHNQAKEKASKLAANSFCPEWPHPATWLNHRRWEDEIDAIPTQLITKSGGHNGTRKYTVADDNDREFKLAANLAEQKAARTLEAERSQRPHSDF